MFKITHKYFSTIPSVFIDGLLFVAIALFTSLSASVSSDEAAKYIDAQTLFWFKMFLSASAATVLALKMYRSTTFSEHQEVKKEEKKAEQKKEEDTKIYVKTDK